MKIAIFTNNYLPNPFGVPNSIETFRVEFERMGHEVFIFAPEWKGFADKNPNVFRYPSLDIEVKIRFPLPIPYSWRIRKILNKLDLDIIHAQHPNLLGSTALRWTRKKKIPLVFTWHTLYDQYTNFIPFVPSGIAAGYMIRRAVKFANKSDAVIVPTASITPTLRKWGVKKEITPVPTGVIEKDFEGANGKIVREKYGIKDDETVLLVVTRLTAEKNMEFLFRSVIETLKENKKIKFLIAADGYLRAELETLVTKSGVGNQVIFAGSVSNEEKKNFYAASDIFVFASKSETQGMVISEAMYMKLPIVAVAATGVESLVVNNGNGLLVKESIEEFSKAILKIIEKKELRKTFSDASFRIAKSQFTSSVTSKKMLELYERLLLNYSK